MVINFLFDKFEHSKHLKNHKINVDLFSLSKQHLWMIKQATQTILMAISPKSNHNCLSPILNEFE